MLSEVGLLQPLSGPPKTAASRMTPVAGTRMCVDVTCKDRSVKTSSFVCRPRRVRITSPLLMRFSERRARLGRQWRARSVAGLAMIGALMGAGTRAAAAPLDEPFVGGMTFDGPTSANLTSVYWNPAALVLVRAFQLMFAASGRLSTVEVNRAPINPMNGTPAP